MQRRSNPPEAQCNIFIKFMGQLHIFHLLFGGLSGQIQNCVHARREMREKIKKIGTSQIEKLV